MLAAMFAESATPSAGARYAQIPLHCWLTVHWCSVVRHVRLAVSVVKVPCSQQQLMMIQVPLSAIERRRKARLEYNRLYNRTHCKMPTYKDPDRYVCNCPYLGFLLLLLDCEQCDEYSHLL